MKVFVDIVFNVWDRLFSSEATRRRRRKALLEKLLNDQNAAPNGIRSLDTLTKRTGMTTDECRALLSELGAEGVTMQDGREGWRKSKDQE